MSTGSIKSINMLTKVFQVHCINWPEKSQKGVRKGILESIIIHLGQFDFLEIFANASFHVGLSMTNIIYLARLIQPIFQNS